MNLIKINSFLKKCIIFLLCASSQLFGVKLGFDRNVYTASTLVGWPLSVGELFFLLLFCVCGCCLVCHVLSWIRMLENKKVQVIKNKSLSKLCSMWKCLEANFTIGSCWQEWSPGLWNTWSEVLIWLPVCYNGDYLIKKRKHSWKWMCQNIVTGTPQCNESLTSGNNVIWECVHTIWQTQDNILMCLPIRDPIWETLTLYSCGDLCSARLFFLPVEIKPSKQ